MQLFAVKAVPAVFWSSSHPLNFRPRLRTFVMLCAGLLLFGVGEALLIASGAGVSPWVVFSQGIANISGWSIGGATFAVSLAVLLLWIPLKQRPGIGTIMNAILIASAMDLVLPYLPNPELYVLRLLEIAAGILLVGIGSGIYLIANLGPGPRDGLMTGLQRHSNLPIAWVRMAIEITVVVLGWLLGGVVGPGTLLFAIGVGWSVSLGLYVVARISNGLRMPVTKVSGSD